MREKYTTEKINKTIAEHSATIFTAFGFMNVTSKNSTFSRQRIRFWSSVSKKQKKIEKKTKAKKETGLAANS